MHVVLIGMMATGKSTVARALAARLGWDRRDSDEDIEARFASSGREIAMSRGVAELHVIEARVLADALADPRDSVIGAAASVVEDPLSRGQLEGDDVFVVWLRARIGTIWLRLTTGDGHRRIADRSELERLDARRGPLFARTADLVLDAERPVADLVEEIVAELTNSGRAADT